MSSNSSKPNSQQHIRDTESGSSVVSQIVSRDAGKPVARDQFFWLGAATVEDVEQEFTMLRERVSQLNIAFVESGGDGLHYLLNMLNVEKQLFTWLEYIVLLTTVGEIREYANEALDIAYSMGRERYRNVDSYNAIVAILHQTNKDARTTIKRCLDREVLVHIHEGVELDERDQIRLDRIRELIAKIESDALRCASGQREIFGISTPTMLHSRIANVQPTAAQQLYETSANQHSANLARLIRLRYQLAKLLGYSSYGAYALRNSMACITKNVSSFLKELTPVFDELYSDEIRMMQSMSRNEPLQAWSISGHCMSMMKRFTGSTQEYMFQSTSVVTILASLASTVLAESVTSRNGEPQWRANTRRFSTRSGDLLVEISTSCRDARLVPLYYRLSTYDADMATSSQSRPVMLIQIPGPIMNLSQIERAILVLGRAVRYIHLGTGLAPLLEAEPDIQDLTGYIMIEAFWEPQVLQRLVLGNGSGITSQMLRYMYRRRNMTTGMTMKFDLLHCKFDLVIHNDYDFVKALRHSKNDDEAGVEELMMLQSRLWQDNMCYKRRQRFTIQPPSVLEASTWLDLYRTPGIAYANLWCRVMAQDIYHNVILGDTPSTYASQLLKYGASHDTYTLMTKILGRGPLYDIFYDRYVHILRSHFDRDDDEVTEQVDGDQIVHKKVVKAPSSSQR
jgi:hypothetical protein